MRACNCSVEDSPAAYDHLVTTWFLNYLGRRPAPDETQKFVGLLEVGESEEQVLSVILGSQEFYARAQTLISSGTSDERFSRRCFSTYWVGRPVNRRSFRPSI